MAGLTHKLKMPILADSQPVLLQQDKDDTENSANKLMCSALLPLTISSLIALAQLSSSPPPKFGAQKKLRYFAGAETLDLRATCLIKWRSGLVSPLLTWAAKLPS